MGTKKLALLVVAAVALVAVASLLRGGTHKSAPQLNGRKILPEISLADVARVEAGEVIVAATDAGWVIETMQNYPADRSKIIANLQKLQDLKVGQVAKGRELKERTPVILRGADGKELASVVLGDRHPKWGFGRYAEFQGETVLVGDMLDSFDNDPKRWCEAKIVDTPWVSFTSLADADVADDVTGLSTGVVAKVTIGDDTNRVATVGNALPNNGGRYLKLDGQPWTYIVPAYSVERLLPKEEEPPASEEKPEMTETPEAPDSPETSDSPAAPETPEAPATPGTPEAPATPGTPEAPATAEAQEPPAAE